MKYQIVGTDESNTEIVLYSFDELKLATKSFNFVVMLAKEPDCMLIAFPSWISIELQQVETISLAQIDGEP